jgi:hypothetical protein
MQKDYKHWKKQTLASIAAVFFYAMAIYPEPRQSSELQSRKIHGALLLFTTSLSCFQKYVISPGPWPIIWQLLRLTQVVMPATSTSVKFFFWKGMRNGPKPSTERPLN